MEWLTTSTILQRLRDFDDRSAWQRFHARFFRPLTSFALRSGLDRTEAEDLAQDVLMAFAEGHRRGQYKPGEGRLSSWLFGIAYRQICSRRRKAQREAQHTDPDAGRASRLVNVPDDHEASQIWNAEWEAATLETCLAHVRTEVAPNTLRAFELTVREGRTAEQAAAELQMTRDAVYVAKHRVLKRLRALLDELDQVCPD
jgi:RNA polymerase sigma-70 factor (ECF subfamily)